MKKVFEALLKLPDYTAAELETLLYIQEIQHHAPIDETNSALANLLVPKDTPPEENIRKAIEDITPLLADVFNFENEIASAWTAVQQNKPAEDRQKHYNSDDMIPIIIGAFPTDYTKEVCINILKKIVLIDNVVQLILNKQRITSSAGRLLYILTWLNSIFMFKFPELESEFGLSSIPTPINEISPETQLLTEESESENCSQEISMNDNIHQVSNNIEIEPINVAEIATPPDIQAVIDQLKKNDAQINLNDEHYNTDL
jgi:hypothetical protein